MLRAPRASAGAGPAMDSATGSRTASASSWRRVTPRAQPPRSAALARRAGSSVSPGTRSVSSPTHCGCPAYMADSAAASRRSVCCAGSGQLGGAFQGRRRGGVSAPGAGALGGLGQSVGHLLVRSERGGGQVPGPAVGFVCQRSGQRQVRLASFGERGGLEDGGAHQRVTESVTCPPLTLTRPASSAGEQRLRRV